MVRRTPQGFQGLPVPVGRLYLREEASGGWVILAADPMIKIDNKHRDGRPHLHVGGWDSADRRNLRWTLTAREACDAIRGQLEAMGYIGVQELLEELS